MLLQQSRVVDFAKVLMLALRIVDQRAVADGLCVGSKSGGAPIAAEGAQGAATDAAAAVGLDRDRCQCNLDYLRELLVDHWMR